MDGLGSSPTERHGLRATWRGYLDFLRDPKLPDRQIPFGRAAWAELLRLYALDVAAMAIIVLGFLLIWSTGVVLPKRIPTDDDPATWFVSVVIMAPLFEELLFRSWLSGRKFHLMIGVAFAGLVTMLVATRLLLGPPTSPQFLFLIGGWLIATLWMLAPRRSDRSVWQPVQRYFAPLFWVSSALFALVHLIGYKEELGMVLIMMTIPQFVSGTILGYARVKLGLWSSMALHGMHNAMAVAIVLAAS